MTTKTPAQKSPWPSLILTILLPTFVLMKASRPLGAELTFFIALSFPLSYGIYEYLKEKKFSLLAALGFFTVLIKGGLGFYKLDGFWFAVNEAAIPTLLFIATLLAIFLRLDWVIETVLNHSAVQGGLIRERLAEPGKMSLFRDKLRIAGSLFAISFLVSAVLNYGLAIYFLKALPGSDQFNEQLGQMNLYSFPVIFISSSAFLFLAIWYLFRSIHALTGLKAEELLRHESK